MPSGFRTSCIVLALSFAFSVTVSAAEIRVIDPDDEPGISGKEVDWIYGDFLMKNEQISLVIAAPLATRDANMTIRNIGGSSLDLTLNHPSNDQLSAYTPTAGRHLFQDPSKVETGREGDAVFWQCRSSRSLADDGTTATVRYRLADGDAFVESTVWIETLYSVDGNHPDFGLSSTRTFVENCVYSVHGRFNVRSTPQVRDSLQPWPGIQSRRPAA